MTETYPIPSKINYLLIILFSLMYFLLLFVSSRTNDLSRKVLTGIAFGIIMTPVYSLIHEAEHNNLHPNRAVNLFLGRYLGCLFIVSFTFIRHCHLKHHKKNRTDEEMWDLYYENQNKWLRYGNLYLMMIGLGYLALWLSVVLFAFAPQLVHSRFFRNHTEIKGFLEGSDNKKKMFSSQIESLVVILFQVLCLWLMNWDFVAWIILFLIHGFFWSSQNYVNHAFSPRDIINGAHNSRIPAFLKILYLNFNVHLAHHQHPHIPWLYLPKFIRSGRGRISFFRNYLRLWKGPELTNEVSPRDQN